MSGEYRSGSDGDEVVVVARSDARRPLPRWTKALLLLSLALMAAGAGLHAYSYAQRGGRPARAARSAPAAAVETGRGGSATPAASPEMPGVLRALPSRTATVSESTRAAGETRSTGSAAEAGTEAPESAIEQWYPGIFRLGFSFFAGFCIAFALRTFFRISVLAIGLGLLFLFGLEYAGLIRVDWVAMEQQYSGVAGWLSAQTAGFRQFVTGQLPSAGMAGLGLLSGFRRH